MSIMPSACPAARSAPLRAHGSFPAPSAENGPWPVRLAVPKAYVLLAPGFAPDADTALSILRHCRRHLAPYKRVRRIEFSDLPKTISGKIRRVELRKRASEGGGIEFREEDFPELKA